MKLSVPTSFRTFGCAWVLLFFVALQASAQSKDEFAVTVRPGDTLISLGKRHLEQPDRWPELRQSNQIRNDRRLKPGSVVRIPFALMRWSELTADVVYVKGAVTGSTGPLVAGAKLKAGDTFDTGLDGALTLRLPDGSVAVFAPKTRGGLGVSRALTGTSVRLTVIDLQSGSVDTTAQPLTAPASRFEIRTPRVVTAVRGTQFRVGADGDISRHEVLTGAVTVGSGAVADAKSDASGKAAKAQLAAAQGLRAEGGKLGAVVTLLAAPQLGQLPGRIERTLQRVAVPPLAGAASWRWQVAVDNAFTQLLQEERTAEPVWHLTNLQDGDYFLRVRAADGQGLEGLNGQKQILVRARPEPPVAFTPSPDADVVNGTTRFTWAENAEAAFYHLQISRTEQFTAPLLDKPDVTGTAFAMDAAWAPGKYFWRLATVLRDGKRGPFGDALAFTLIEPSAMAPPALDGKTVRLAWSGPKDLSHRVQVANEATFAKPLHDQTVKALQVSIDTPEPGNYYVRTLALLPNGKEGPWSAPQRFEVAPPPFDWRPYLLLIPLLFLPLL